MIEATPRPFDLGVAEANDGIGMTYDNDPESPRSVEYDTGRTIGQLPEPWRTTIVKAVNAHDALVAALGAAYEALARVGEQTEAAAAYEALEAAK